MTGTGRRELTGTVVAAALGAGLILLAASHTWTEEIIAQAAPLAPLHAARTGSSLHPWLPAVAWVAVAGAGALLAFAGWVRLAVGALLVLGGMGVSGGITTRWVTTGGISAPVWATLVIVAGLLITGCGLAVLVRGRHWPALGRRYERAAASGPPPADAPRSAVTLWDALDRGEDPTISHR